jgi:hypothetical protein
MIVAIWLLVLLGACGLVLKMHWILWSQLVVGLLGVTALFMLLREVTADD